MPSRAPHPARFLDGAKLRCGSLSAPKQPIGGHAHLPTLPLNEALLPEDLIVIVHEHEELLPVLITLRQFVQVDQRSNLAQLCHHRSNLSWSDVLKHPIADDQIELVVGQR